MSDDSAPAAALPAADWRVSSGVQDPAAVDRLLRSLPAWFGIESAIVQYAESAAELAIYRAWPQAAPGSRDAGQPAGILLAARHFPCSAEIHLMAVEAAQHRRGAGRALIRALEADLVADGVELLEVKTLGPSRRDPGYDRTRQFYAGLGFRPLEEIHGLWGANPCLVMVKVLR